MEEELASVLERPEVLLVHGHVKTTGGGYVASPPTIRLDPAAPAREIGIAVRTALDAFRSGVADPDDSEWLDLNKTFLKAAGFRSWRALENGAKLCHVTRRADGTYVFQIMRNGGTRGDKKGFQSFGVPDQYLNGTASDSELGTAVRTALEACK